MLQLKVGFAVRKREMWEASTTRIMLQKRRSQSFYGGDTLK